MKNKALAPFFSGNCNFEGEFMKGKRIIGILQSCLLILLFLSLLVQCVFYVSFVEKIGGTGLEPFPDSEIRLLSGFSGGMSPSGLVSPCFIGVLGKDTGGRGVMLPMSEDSETAKEAWLGFVSVLENSQRGTAKQITFSDSSEKSTYLSQLYMNSEPCYYARFADGIEFSVLASVLSGVCDVMPENPDFVISDMFLVCGSNGEASIIATDLDGEVLKIFPSKNITFNNEILTAYTDTGENLFFFKNLAEGKRFYGNGYFPVLNRTLTAPSLVRSDFDSFFSISEASDYSRRLMKMFGINADNVKNYNTSDGDMVFVEDTNRLNVSKDGRVEYIPDEDGTPVSEIFTTDNSGFGAISDAARFIATSLSDTLSLCDADITLRGVYLDGSVCRFEYCYSANGIPIIDGNLGKNNATAISLDFYGDRLVGAVLNVVPYRFSGKASTEIPQKSALALLSDELYSEDERVSYFGAQYLFDEGERESELVFAVRTEKEVSR